MTLTFPKFTFDGDSLQYVKTFKYLGHIITDTFSDDDDIHREIRNMFIRTNIRTRRFSKCSADVKIILFRAYCMCLYDAGLWSRYKAGSFNKLLSCYNKCLKCYSGSNAETSLHRFCLIWICLALIQLCIIARLFLVTVFVVAPMLLSGILIVYCRLYADCIMIMLSVSVSVYLISLLPLTP